MRNFVNEVPKSGADIGKILIASGTVANAVPVVGNVLGGVLLGVGSLMELLGVNTERERIFELYQRFLANNWGECNRLHQMNAAELTARKMNLHLELDRLANEYQTTTSEGQKRVTSRYILVQTHILSIVEDNLSTLSGGLPAKYINDIGRMFRNKRAFYAGVDKYKVPIIVLIAIFLIFKKK